MTNADAYATIRANEYLDRADSLRVARDVACNIARASIDVHDANVITNELHRILHDRAYASYESDDDFDDFVHELDHANGTCDGNADDCIFYDEDDQNDD